jgi:diacylglycerol O-acyltransferase / wax synthase
MPDHLTHFRAMLLRTDQLLQATLQRFAGLAGSVRVLLFGSRMEHHADPLSSLDSFFLGAEGEHTPMHIGATLIFEEGPLGRGDGTIDVAAIERHVAARLHRTPRYRQRLARTPLEARAVWVDDEDFRLDAHVKHVRLDAGSSDPALASAAGEILARALDRRRPLWELWVIDGLDGGRFAIVTKVHHCLADGLAGVEQLASLMDPSPDSSAEEPLAWTPRPAPAPLELAGDEVAAGMRRAAAAAGWLRETIRAPRSAWRDARKSVLALADTALSALPTIRPTPINGPLGPNRTFRWLAMDLAEVRLVRRRLGGTLNDVVLATVAGALRRYLPQRGLDVYDGEIRAAVPVSMRDHSSPSGNQVSLWLLPLPLHEPDPAARIELVHRAAAERKASGTADGLYALTQLGNGLGPAVFETSARLLERLLPFHVIVTNVPGPQFPLYMSGARLLAAYPSVPLFAQQGLGVALFSYDGKLYWGFLADPSLVPQLETIVYAIAGSFCELLERAVEADRAPSGRSTEAA